MKSRPKKLCELCAKSFSTANIARHKRCMHSYCRDCRLLVSKKRHRCFLNFSPIPPPKEEDQYLLVHIPVLIRKQLYDKLDANGSLWPVYNVSRSEDLSEKVKKVLRRECITCCVSEFVDIPEDRHSCVDPNQEEFVAALRQCTDDISEQTIYDVYRTTFGGHVL